MKKKTVDIIIKTYLNDFKWLFYCLKSVEKFATNYNKLIIIYPEGSWAEFNQIVARHFNHFNWEAHEVKEEGSGYLFQQVVKMQAHKYSKADFIKYLDSDCILTKPFDAYSLITKNKPQYLYRPYFNDKGENQVDGAVCWKEPTEKVLKQKVDMEFMCRHIFCYHRSTLENFEKWMFNKHSMSVKEYVLSQERFSEFNALGAFAFYHERKKYDFLNTQTEWEYVDQQLKQYHSYTEFEQAEPQMKELLGL